jgi:hypothetical protein
MSTDELHGRLARLEDQVGDIRETLGEVRGLLCKPKDLSSALKEPSTLIVLVTVLAASASGQSIQMALQTLTQQP